MGIVHNGMILSALASQQKERERRGRRVYCDWIIAQNNIV